MIFSWGVEQRWLAHNPAVGVKAPRALPRPVDEQGDRARIWTPSEYDAFRQHADATYATGTVAAARDPWVRAGMRLTTCGRRRSANALASLPG